MQTKYLYSAAVNGIQSFIFETGKLKEIVGGSEFVLQIGEKYFPELLGTSYESDNHVLNAAGKLIYRFDNLADCQRVIKAFPRLIREVAPTIQFSQAVVAIEGEGTKNALDTLDKLLNSQRNKSLPQHGMGFMITERARRTGRSGADKEIKYFPNTNNKEALMDRTQIAKVEAFKNNTLAAKMLPRADRQQGYKLADSIEEIAPNNKGWLAIVHADGNSLGKNIQRLLNTSRPDLMAFYQRFSRLLDEATTQAAQNAYSETIKHKTNNRLIPLRPVLLGGDDLTLIIRGDLALEFTAAYLKNFEEQTAAKFAELDFPENLKHLYNGITACAGIAFIKPNYPFHYGVNLSDGLTKYAKKAAKRINKNTPPSSLAFHKVQSSFIGDYDSIVERELQAEAAQIQFNHGPYFLAAQKYYSTVAKLDRWIGLMKKEDAPRSNLREWLSELQTNPDAADQLMERIISINPRYSQYLSKEELIIERMDVKKDMMIKTTPIFDALTIASI